MNARLRARLHGDPEAGLGLILVIGVSVFVFLIAAAATALAVNSMAQGRQRTEFEVSLAVAESGIDRALSEIQSAYTDFAADYPIPGATSPVETAPWCTSAAVSFPPSGEGAGGVFSTEAAERTWARTQLDALVGAGTCVQDDERGQYVVLKPPSPNVKYGNVYALSAIPSFADPGARLRLVKAEYVFMPYRPTHAILAAGDIEISSSTTVTGAAGVDPTLAAVHTNGVLSGTGNPTVTGPVTSSGTSTFSSNNFTANTGGAVATKLPEPIPVINARTFYRQAALNDPAAVLDWYDLCPEGSVRPYSPAGPCDPAATSIGNGSALQVRGWDFDAGTRTWIASVNTLDGTYFALDGNIDVGPGNTTFARMTLVAAAENATTCGTKQYGNITWDHFDLATPAYHNLWLFADSDIVTNSNFTAGSLGPPVVSGMFVAGDQVEMETSSQGAVGSVVTASQCETPVPDGLITTSEVKNPAVYYDPNADAPFASVITTTLWLDYSGS